MILENIGIIIASAVVLAIFILIIAYKLYEGKKIRNWEVFKLWCLSKDISPINPGSMKKYKSYQKRGSRMKNTCAKTRKIIENQDLRFRDGLWWGKCPHKVDAAHYSIDFENDEFFCLHCKKTETVDYFLSWCCSIEIDGILKTFVVSGVPG